ncbi:hypothetical protein PCAR4_460118 [Paraburkholderia caribensis]|nr:hypothetical protein PCAR4_460118 [Paraburkholderia caribensis]
MDQWTASTRRGGQQPFTVTGTHRVADPVLILHRARLIVLSVGHRSWLPATTAVIVPPLLCIHANKAAWPFNRNIRR